MADVPLTMMTLSLCTLHSHSCWASQSTRASYPLAFAVAVLSPSISTCNKFRSTGLYFLGLASRFLAFLTAGLRRTDQGLPSGQGSTCLFNFCPQHFKIISQDLDWSQENMNILRCALTPVLPLPQHLEDR